MRVRRVSFFLTPLLLLLLLSLCSIPGLAVAFIQGSYSRKRIRVPSRQEGFLHRLYVETKQEEPVAPAAANGEVDDKEAASPPIIAHNSPRIPILSSLLLESESYNLIAPAAIGLTTGLAVALFKLSIEGLRELTYGNYVFPQYPELLFLIPTLGGLLVGLTATMLSPKGRPFPPGLRDTVLAVDQQARPAKLQDVLEQQWNFFRKSASAVFTLGTGNSLGPEGPSVELGMNVARAILNAAPVLPKSATFPSDFRGRNRLLLSCGAAAGVSAGFNAPLAGVFFVLEVMQGAFQAADERNQRPSDFLSIAPGSISAILLSSVLSALVSRALLGNTLILELSNYSMNTPFLELPIYLVLGTFSGVVAFVFSQTANLSQSFFNGKVGPETVQQTMRSVPPVFKPALGGLFCGVVGLVFPQILFFGYETLNTLLATDSLSTEIILTLLAVKLISTAVSAGSGLVGGTFAPSLFLGAMLGAAFHDGLIPLLTSVPENLWSVVDGPVLDLADVQAYAMVGAGSVLAALFRAPLTASLLLFELTRDYDVILPLMASAGVGSVVGDILEGRLKRSKEAQKRLRDQDAVSWGDLSNRVADVMESLVDPKKQPPSEH